MKHTYVYVCIWGPGVRAKVDGCVPDIQNVNFCNISCFLALPNDVKNTLRGTPHLEALLKLLDLLDLLLGEGLERLVHERGLLQHLRTQTHDDSQDAIANSRRFTGRDR